MIEFILMHGAEVPTRAHKYDTGADLKIKGIHRVVDGDLYGEPMWFDDINCKFKENSFGAKYVVVASGETVLFKTGVQIQIKEDPKIISDGYLVPDIQIRGRSGNNLKTKKEVKLGSVDFSYQNDLGIIMHNEGTEPIKVYENEKLGQLVIGFCVAYDKWKVVDSFEEETDRGLKCFGSTGS